MTREQMLTLKIIGGTFIGGALCAMSIIYLYALAGEADEIHYCKVLTPDEYAKVGVVVQDDSEPKVYQCADGIHYRGVLISTPRQKSTTR
jgi:hypothetical protein